MNDSHPNNLPKAPFILFDGGGKWMALQLQMLDGLVEPNDVSKIPFTLFGLFKYAICMTIMAAVALLLTHINPLLVVLSIPVFYWAEIHFLFLFPLLIDKVERPFITSFRLTYQLGFLRLWGTVMLIGFFMMIGLFRLHNPLRNWYIGCLALLIWYRDEVRNRL